MLLKSRYELLTILTSAKSLYQKKYSNIRYILLKWWILRSVLRIDKDEIPASTSEIRLFAVFRNESLRLDHFMKYYTDLGVDRFILLNNNSSDHSEDIISKYKNVHLFRTSRSYKEHWYWMEALLDKYGIGHWCLVVDIDELFYFPGAENISLKQFCEYLDKNGESAVRSLLLDLYPNCAISEVQYVSGQDPLAVLRYFDSEFEKIEINFFDRKRWSDFSCTTYVGGMRDRVFQKNMPNHLSKISLLRFERGTYLTQGMHAVNGATLSDIHGVTLHTKFLQDFHEEAIEEAKRGQHFDNASVYKIFLRRLQENPDLTFYSETSIEFESSQQFINLGIVKITSKFEHYFSMHSW